MVCLVYHNFESVLTKLRDSNLTLQKEDVVAGSLSVPLAADSENGSMDLTHI